MSETLFEIPKPPCPECGKALPQGQRLWCSKVCGDRVRQRSARNRRRAQTPCANCSKTIPSGRRRFCSDGCAGAAEARAAAAGMELAAIQQADQERATATRLDAELSERIGQLARATHEMAMLRAEYEAVAKDAAMLATFLDRLHAKIGGQWYGQATRALVAKYLAEATATAETLAARAADAEVATATSAGLR